MAAPEDTGRAVTRLVAGVLFVAACVLYAWRLDAMPTYISPDEAIISVDAYELATTGRDLKGTSLPLYFHIQMPGETRFGWFTPVIFYLSAAFYQVLPFTEWSVRLPSVFIGLVNLLVIYLLAKRLFDSAWIAMAAAGVLALSPAHFIFSRYALDYLYPVPFILLWLLCLQRALAGRASRWLFLSSLCLGLGFYSYAAAVLLVPVFLVLSLAVWFAETGDAKSGAWAALGFGLPLVAFAIWLGSHPSAFGDTAQRYALYDARNLNALQGLKELLGFPNVERMTSLYWSFFNPAFLFLSGDQSMTFSTRAAGVFPQVLVLLIPIGVFRILSVDRTPFNLLLLAGFVIAPMPAVLVPEAGAINRATAMLPFGALLAAFGVKQLAAVSAIRFARPAAGIIGATALALGVAYAAWTVATEGRLSGSAAGLVGLGVVLIAFTAMAARVAQGPVLAIGLLALVVMQFGSFSRDYFGDYRVRLNSWLGGNLRGALEAIIERRPEGDTTFVYFAHLQSTSGLADIRNYWMDAYWRFYLIKHHREDLLAQSGPLDATRLDAITPGSLVLGNRGDRIIEGLIESRQLTPVVTVPELDRDPFFVILEKAGS